MAWSEHSKPKSPHPPMLAFFPAFQLLFRPNSPFAAHAIYCSPHAPMDPFIQTPSLPQRVTYLLVSVLSRVSIKVLSSLGHRNWTNRFALFGIPCPENKAGRNAVSGSNFHSDAENWAWWVGKAQGDENLRPKKIRKTGYCETAGQLWVGWFFGTCTWILINIDKCSRPSLPGELNANRLLARFRDSAAG